MKMGQKLRDNGAFKNLGYKWKIRYRPVVAKDIRVEIRLLDDWCDQGRLNSIRNMSRR